MFSAAVVAQQARVSAGLGLRELAEIVGRPPSTINRIEHGHVEPSVSLMAEVLEACGFALTVVPNWAAPTRRDTVVPSASSPEPPTTYPNPRHNDPWDNDAVHWLLKQQGGSRWTHGVLFEHARRQRRLVERDAPRLSGAAELAARHGVLQIDMFDHELGKQIVHLIRTDANAPAYPEDRIAAARR
jgi:transcriptional regulator with XRE-family HTH domain